RKHPVYDLISSAVRGVFYGLLQGLLLVAFFGPVEASTVIGVNAFYFAFNVFGANLRHSHVWLSFGPVIEHVFISPAQHQIHHSRAVEHHDKNYGEVLAVWDWVFGTLYVPKRRERLSFGLADGEGRPIEQPHGGLRAALVGPVRDAAAVVFRRGDGDAARR
ncbi:MAG: sterol desaturase family protein, partial [Pseudomonadota bacterium]